MTCFKIIFAALTVCLFFLSGCKAPVESSQRIYISAAKNIHIVSVSGQLNSPAKKPPVLTAADSSSLKHLYATVKRLYKLERKAEKHTVQDHSKSFAVRRTNQPLIIAFNIDSIQKEIDLQPRKNYGRFLNMKYLFRSTRSSGIDYKHWIYPRKNHIAVDEDGIHITRFPLPQKGGFKMNISAGIHLFNLKTDSGKYNNGGVLGVEAGVGYYYRRNKFISMSIGAATDLLPLPMDYFGIGYIERGSAFYTSVRDNFILGRFEAGYGLNLSRLYWTGIPHGDSSLPTRKVRTTSTGLSFSVNYYLRPNMKVGVVYQPNLFNINQNFEWSYQHLIRIGTTVNFGKRRPVKK